MLRGGCPRSSSSVRRGSKILPIGLGPYKLVSSVLRGLLAESALDKAALQERARGNNVFGDAQTRPRSSLSPASLTHRCKESEARSDAQTGVLRRHHRNLAKPKPPVPLRQATRQYQETTACRSAIDYCTHTGQARSARSGYGCRANLFMTARVRLQHSALENVGRQCDHRQHWINACCVVHWPASPLPVTSLHRGSCVASRYRNALTCY